MRKGTAARVVAQGLACHVAGGVAWLRLDRPQAGNRITPALAQALCDAAAAIELDDGVSVVVLAANGPSFCLGVDPSGDWEGRSDWVEAIAALTRPVIAAVHGDAIAEGLELALACDLRVISARAQLALPQLAEGRLPRHGGTQRLPRLVGRMRAMDLVLTGRRFDAAEAAAIGIASRIVPAAQLDRAVAALVGALAAQAPIALRYAKEAVRAGGDLTLGQGMRLEEDLYALLQTTRDRTEGIRAFLQKRKPIFRGR